MRNLKYLMPLFLVVTITLLAAYGVFLFSNSGNGKTDLNESVTPESMGIPGGMHLCI